MAGVSYGKGLGIAAAVLIMLGFGKSALDQVGIATTVTGPLLYAILGTVAGVVIVGAGGGLIKPMQGRWETMLNKAEMESSNAKAQMQSSTSATSQPYPSETTTATYTTTPPTTTTYGTPR